jgi:hypothetical protein
MKFESAMLLLENLTPHQVEKYGQVEAALRSGQRVDIRAPAGAGKHNVREIFQLFNYVIVIKYNSGKTFIALKVLLEEVLNGTRDISLFVTRSEALCVHVAKWLFVRLRQRLDETEAKRKLEKCFRVLFPPFVFTQDLRRWCINVDLERQCVSLIDGSMKVIQSNILHVSLVFHHLMCRCLAVLGSHFS